MGALQKMIPSDYVTEYVAGTLETAKALMISCQRSICEEAAYEIESQETIASSIMANGEGAALSADFFSRLFARPELEANPTQEELQETQQCATASEMSMHHHTETANNSAHAVPANDKFPLPLINFMCGKAVKWSFLAPGMKSMSLWRGKDGQQLWLLKAKGGLAMPEHSHIGEEWSLILSGSYHVGCTQYSRGDLHVEDEHCTHIPIIDPGKDCICLILTEGPMKPIKLLTKLLMPLARI